MSRSPSPWTNKDKLNRSTPASADVQLGQIIDDLITQHNALLADHKALEAKLNTAGGTVAGLGTNYGAADTAQAVTVLSAR